MYVYDWPTLDEQFPEYVLVDLSVEVAGVDRGLLVSLVERGDHGHGSLIY